MFYPQAVIKPWIHMLESYTMYVHPSQTPKYKHFTDHKCAASLRHTDVTLTQKTSYLVSQQYDICPLM